MKNKTFYFSALLLIFIIQIFWATNSHHIPDWQKRTLTSGFVFPYAKPFFYFYYYTGLFPLATLSPIQDYSHEEAYRLIREEGHNLIMEYKHWSRMGENARIWAFFPDAWLKKTAQAPSIKTFNGLVFLTGLWLVFTAFYRAGYPFTGLILCIIISITPYFPYEVYRNKNIFALQASVFLWVLGLNMHFLYKKIRPVFSIILPFITGIIIAFFSEIRGEILQVLLAAILLYIFANQKNWLWKGLMLVILVLAFYNTRQLIRHYFDRKFEETARIVSQHGGHVYTGPRLKAHSFWHPVWCGLGDFDHRFGYAWDDTKAYQFALPLLNRKYGFNFTYSGGYAFDQYYDKDSLYYIKPEDLPEYDQIIKQKVLSDIQSHPGWYVAILLKRLLRILTHTLPFSGTGWLFFPVVYLLLRKKQWTGLKILISSLVLSLSPLLIFSGGNATYNSLFPLISLCFLISMCINKIRKGEFVLS